jgi:O-antigen/teichoic acid export membrane protein
MYPHGRLVLSALIFSVSLGLLVAGTGWLAAVWLASEPPLDPPDNAPIRAAGLIIFIFAPLVAIASLGVAIPSSYYLWRNPRAFVVVVAGIAVLAAATVVAWSQPGSSLGATAIMAALFAALTVLAALSWRLSLPRSNKSLERTREG